MVNTEELNTEETLKRIIQLHKEAVAGNETAVQDLHMILEQLRDNYSDNPLLKAYHGNTMILIARDNTKPLDKLRWSKSGLKLLDEAVHAAPRDWMIRLLRGKTAYMLPEQHFHRAHTAIEDYTLLIDQNMLHDQFLEKNQYMQLIYELGEVYYRIGQNQEASRCWIRLQQLTEDSDFIHLLHLKLKKLEGKPAVENIPHMDRPSTILLKKTVRAMGNEFQNWVGNQKTGTSTKT